MSHKSNTIELVLPYPPSVNHYWIHKRGGGMFICDAGRRYRHKVEVIKLLNLPGHQPIINPVMVQLLVYPPDRKKRDLDNIKKCLFDSLVKAGIIEDDNQIIDDSSGWAINPEYAGPWPPKPIAKMYQVVEDGKILIRITEIKSMKELCLMEVGCNMT